MTGLTLTVDRVRHRYPGRTEDTPTDVSFSLPAAGVGVLVGPNGAGKTTLLMRIVGLLSGPGEVRVGDWVVAPGHHERIRRCVGLVWQDPDDSLLLPTVLEDVALGPVNDGLSRAEALAVAASWLDRLGVSPLADREVATLSRGEKQVVALAGVLAREPGLVLLDEPASSLDPAARARVAEVLRSLSATRLVVSHGDDDFVRGWAPDALVIEVGAGRG